MNLNLQMQLTLLPFDEIVLNINLFPLVCGYVTLPKLILVPENSEIIITCHDIPTHIYILVYLFINKLIMYYYIYVKYLYIIYIFQPQKKVFMPTVDELEKKTQELEIV